MDACALTAAMPATGGGQIGEPAAIDAGGAHPGMTLRAGLSFLIRVQRRTVVINEPAPCRDVGARLA